MTRQELNTLKRLVTVASRIDATHHAGLTPLNADWSELYAALQEAKALIAQKTR